MRELAAKNARLEKAGKDALKVDIDAALAAVDEAITAYATG